MQNTAILIQARMSSTRCPGKVLADLKGSPLIERLLQSLEKNEHALPVILCTSTETSDDLVADFCSKRGTPFFRGSLNNVAERFIHAAEAFKLEHLIRISGDSPWFNVSLANQAIETYFKTLPDICCNIYPRSFPKGQSLEVFSTELLKRFYTKMDASDQEHVTPIFYRHGKDLKIENVANTSQMNHLDLSIDTPEQLAKTREIFEHLEKPHWQYSIAEILDLFKLKP